MSLSEQTTKPNQVGRLASWLRYWPIGVLLATGVVAFCFGYYYREEQLPNGGLVVAEEQLDFGEMMENKDFVWDLQLVNPTEKEVKIQKIISSCICQRIEPESVTIPPRAQRKLRLTIDLTHTNAGKDLAPLRDFVVQIFPVIKGAPFGQTGWKIKGKVRTPFTFSPNFVHFGKTLIQGQSLLSQKITIYSHLPHRSIEISCNPQFAKIILLQNKDNPNCYEAEIIPQPTLPVSFFHFEVGFQLVDLQGNMLPIKTLPVAGYFFEDIVVYPSTIHFGAKQMGEKVEENVVLRSKNAKHFIPERFDKDSSSVFLEPITLGFASKHVFRLTQTIAQPGNQSHSVQFFLKKEDGTLVKIILPISYYGILKIIED